MRNRFVILVAAAVAVFALLWLLATPRPPKIDVGFPRMAESYSPLGFVIMTLTNRSSRPLWIWSIDYDLTCRNKSTELGGATGSLSAPRLLLSGEWSVLVLEAMKPVSHLPMDMDRVSREEFFAQARITVHVSGLEPFDRLGIWWNTYCLKHAWVGRIPYRHRNHPNATVKIDWSFPQSSR